MSEIIALTRLSFAHSRTALTIAIAYMLLIHLCACVYGLNALEGNLAQQKAASGIVIMFSLPLLGVTFALFDFSDHGEVGSCATGYLPWLLRMPIKTWKLAAVPLGLKTLWTLLVCGAVALTSRIAGTPLERWFIPAIGIASLFVLASLVTWQPFRWTHTRLSLIGILFVPSYAWLIASVSLAFADQRSDIPTDTTSITAAWVIGLSTFTALTLLALRAVRLARFNVSGQIMESRVWTATKATASPSSNAASSVEMTYKHPAKVSPVAALLHFDSAKLGGLGAKLVLAGWLLIISLASFGDQVGTDNLVFLIVLFLFPGIFLNEWMITSLDQRFLPNVLAVAPIPTTTIVWTRQIITTAIWFASLLGIPIVLLIWHLKGADSRMIDAWQRVLGSQFDSPDAVGRLAVAISIVGVLLVVRQTTWNVLANSTDEKRFLYWMIAAKFAVGFAAFSWFLFQFMRFPNWEAWTQWAWQCIAELPMLLPWLALVKLIIVTIATTMLYRSALARRQTVIGLAVGYLACVLLIAAFLWQLMPSDGVELWHCIAATAVVMPCSRITMAPLFLAYNRHR